MSSPSNIPEAAVEAAARVAAQGEVEVYDWTEFADYARRPRSRGPAHARGGLGVGRRRKLWSSPCVMKPPAAPGS